MGNVVMYFLNLPDNGTLIQLSNGQIPSVTSISPVNTYTLAQLKNVIREIIRINNRATAMINLNTQDPDPNWNPGDHTDHLATGAIVNAAVTEVFEFRCVNRLFYRGYVIGAFAQNYTQEEVEVHTATIGALDATLIANGNRSTWDAFHNNFIGKMDFRGILGVGNCAF
jgi:LmbE family N-acetylglucosaminyl deacetylase